jgi:hypothetical protein
MILAVIMINTARHFGMVRNVWISSTHGGINFDTAVEKIAAEIKMKV